ncbi:hypothetical protein EVAR_16644_1 [Eumeta japonica]|uniref:Uncharacterized protein n=1 Tax=Eumeta variegata TaxID=151549 RepID=A0A4C1V058_EUMVA|nr:hypothetical protein EVAR_16644_1 [Eumeta japonica]
MKHKLHDLARSPSTENRQDTFTRSQINLQRLPDLLLSFCELRGAENSRINLITYPLYDEGTPDKSIALVQKR